MQTLYLVCALAVASLLGLNVQTSQVRTMTQMAQTEVEGLALATAEDILDWADTLPFDEQAGASSPSDLTRPVQFGTQSGTFDAVVDLDDLDGARRTEDVEVSEGTIALSVEASVRYVTPAASGHSMPGASSDILKEVTLRVTGPLGAAVTVSRLYPFQAGL